MSFNESRLLDCVAYGSEFGHEYSTRIVRLKSGVERRNAEWSFPLGKYAVIYNNLDAADHAAVIAAHHACMGSLIGFRFKDFSDYTATDNNVGTGTGSPTEYQLRRAYTMGSITQYRPIYKPVEDTVVIKVDGEVDETATVDYETGIVAVDAEIGEVITWSGQFDVPVRFASDEIGFAYNNYSGGPILTSNVDLVEIRL